VRHLAHERRPGALDTALRQRTARLAPCRRRRHNGDSKDDIIWRNNNGTIATWEMNSSAISATHTFAAVSADWHIAGNHFDFI